MHSFLDFLIIAGLSVVFGLMGVGIKYLIWEFPDILKKFYIRLKSMHYNNKYIIPITLKEYEIPMAVENVEESSDFQGMKIVSGHRGKGKSSLLKTYYLANTGLMREDFLFDYKKNEYMRKYVLIGQDLNQSATEDINIKAVSLLPVGGILF